MGNTTIMFSYSTPVAGKDDDGLFRTDTSYTPTTTRHITKYLGGKDKGRVVPQAWIDSLVGGEG